jgi:quercetin dioxygenase-like cupin family protein
MELAPGVTAEALAFLPGEDEPVAFRLRFQPGSSVDLGATPEASLVVVEAGTLTLTTDVDLIVYSSGAGMGDPGSVAAGSAATLQQGDYFLVPANVAGHASNDGDAEASILVGALQVGASSAASSVPPSAAP